MTVDPMTLDAGEDVAAAYARPPARRHGLLGRAAGWVQADHLRRGPHLLAPAVYGLAALAHTMEAPALFGVPLTALAALGMYTRAMNQPGDATDPARAAAVTVLAGGWVTAATALGPTAGPHGLMTWLAAATYGLTYWAYRRDPGIVQAIAWENAKEDWHVRAPRYGLGGSHLLDWRETRLGEQMVVDTRGTGKRASQLVASGVEELIAEEEMLRPSRVKVRRGDIAGRITISIRYKDPWAEALPHPLLDATPEIPLPAVADGREPRIIGLDPETGNPLQVSLWDEDGAKRVLVVAITGGGKTVTLSNLIERDTAADNVFPIGISVGKGKEMRRWRPALGLSACGPGDRVKALRILELVAAIIDWRAAQDGDEVTVIPRRSQPLIPVYVDEVDTLLGESDAIGMATRKVFGDLMTRGRSEGVPVVVAGGRGTVEFLGNGKIKKMFDLFALLKTAGESEIRHVLGEIGLTMPDMMRYGEGHSGVALITDLAGHWTSGRTWKLKDLPDIDRLVRSRTPCPLEPELVEFLGDKLAAITGDEPPAPRRTRRTPPKPAPAPAPEADMPQDTIDRAAQQRAEARARLAEVVVPAVDELTAGQAKAAAMARRRQAADQTEMTPEIRSLLLRLASSPEGTTTREAERAMQAELGYEVGVSKSGAWRCLDKLRFEGVVELRGKGRGARWHLAAQPAPDPAPGEGVDGEFEHELAVEQIEEAATEEAADSIDDHEE
ncbi:hypothetical protein Sme01_02600 [Sphaerisporangium melleum]|uniref:FtsK domain-containing protein n=1 Tax=Sphaerisporangium melleum TaxID=321316 RepID=A0A917VBY3_9ACTN|nr:hypothetical protein [Sphaerisporangium melleum]GGK60998.1 hypothetical protein GCM10007964_00140 [Sphaerisporangium melleum]GII67784.1 hypothetical protein Sme01_02600 [Sphaerisporangium melleum]